MLPEDILTASARVLNQSDREAYFRDGVVAVDGVIDEGWLARLQAVSEEMVARSGAVAQSTEAFDIGPGHSARVPHLRRLRAAVDQHPDLWTFAGPGPLADIAADLVGPDVKFHSAKLNYKWPGYGEVVKWHQDIPAWPHTNYSPVTLGVYLSDVGPEDGPLVAIAGSHEGELFSHTDTDGGWRGSVTEADMAGVDMDCARPLTGRAGTLVAINCRTLHASGANDSARPRPLLLNVYSSADAFAWMPAPTPTRHTGEIVRGEPARLAHLDPRPCPVPPNWDEVGYGSIFTAQATSPAAAE